MIAVAVVGHVARQDQAHQLTRKLGGRLFLDNGQLGEIENHRRAWQWIAEQDRTATGSGRPAYGLVIQDDAIPVDRMLGHLESAVAFYLPTPGFVSLYLGTSYPTQWQKAIGRALDRADKTGASWIVSDRLLHGVAVAAPACWGLTIAAELGAATGPYDEELTGTAKALRLPVYYPVPSLVDHADGPTLLDHPDGKGRTKSRHAWRTGVPNWNNKTVRL